MVPFSLITTSTVMTADVMLSMLNGKPVQLCQSKHFVISPPGTEFPIHSYIYHKHQNENHIFFTIGGNN